MESTWYSRDLPILDFVVAIFEANDPAYPVTAEEIITFGGWSPDEVLLALHALDGEYLRLQVDTADREQTAVLRVLPAARRMVGQWPSAEELAVRFLDELGQAAQTEADPRRRSWLGKVAAELGSGGRDLAINVLASVIAKSTGIG